MTAQEFMDGTTVTPRGDDWGDPLWTFYNESEKLGIDAQGATLSAATASALAAAETILAAR